MTALVTTEPSASTTYVIFFSPARLLGRFDLAGSMEGNAVGKEFSSCSTERSADTGGVFIEAGECDEAEAGRELNVVPAAVKTIRFLGF